MNTHLGMIALFVLTYCIFVWCVWTIIAEDRRDGR
jgi:hypothetical protein